MNSPILLIASAGLLYAALSVIYKRILRPPFNNIDGPPSGNIISGNLKQCFGHDAWDYIENLVDTYGPIARIQGFLRTPWLHVCDPKALHSILVKDQESYFRGTATLSFVTTIFGPGLFSTTGARHKKQRKMLNPVFSGAHMRNLTPIFHTVVHRLKTALETRLESGTRELDLSGWMGRTALELVGHGGLGHSFDPLTSDSQDAYTEAVKGFSAAGSDLRHLRGFMPFLTKLGPAWLRRALLDLVPSRRVQRVKNNCDRVNEGSMRVFYAKKAAIERGDEEVLRMVGEGKDVMSVLLRENMKAAEEDKLQEDELLAQMATFIVAGTDTTSTALARTLHLLCLHPDAQDKLRVELRQAHEQHGDMITYDELNKLTYLDAICRETLRLYAPVTFSNREACADTVLPLSEPVRGLDGRTITEVPIPKGTTLLLNLRACNTSAALWGDDARTWRPTRWLEPLPRALEEARVPGIYANLMTFLAGGNACIGFKFSQLEMKVVLYTLVNAFKFELSDKPVVWNFAGIAYPASNRASSKPEMYLKVSLMQNDA